MLKFFRKIRQELLSDRKTEKSAFAARPNGFLSGRTGRYLKYALGEIILVVLGILIALQINNWNEQRKIIQAEKDLYQHFLTDLQLDENKIENLK